MSDANHPSSDIPKIGRPANSALTEAGYTHLEQLTHVREKDIANLHGMGPKGMKILRQAMAEKGLSFADQTPSQNAE